MGIRLSPDFLERVVAPYATELWEGVAEEFRDRAREKCSRRSGELWDAIEVSEHARAEGGVVTARVTVDSEYGVYQDQGTGIYGPEGTRIVAEEGHALRFDWPAAGGIVFFKSVAGSPGTHYWERTVEEWPEIVRDA